MSAAASAADVERAVTAMYEGEGEHRQLAIRWLSEFAASSASADVYPVLLRSASPRVQFYGATGVYNVVVTHWHRLSEAQRSTLSAFLWGCLSGAGGLDAPVRRKLCAALAAAVVLAAEHGEPLGSVVVRVCAFTGGSGDAAAVLLHVALLESVAEEADRQHMPHARAELIRRDLSSRAPAVLAALSWAACSPASPFASGDAGVRERGLCAVLLCARAWTRYGTTLGSLWTTSGDLLGVAVQALALDPPTGSPSWAAASAAAADWLESVVETRQYPRKQERSAALAALVEAMVSVHARIRFRLQSGEAPPSASAGLYSLSLVATSIATIEDAWCAITAAATPHSAVGLTGAACPFMFAESDQAMAAEAAGLPLGDVARRLAAGDLTVGGARAGIGVLLGDLLLQLGASPDLRVAQECLSGAMALQALDTKPRHPFFRRPFFRQLVLVAVRQCASPAPSASLAEYRGPRSPLRDALPDAAAQLREEYVSTLIGWLRVGSVPRDVGPPLPPFSPDARLEAVLFCLDVASSTLLDILDEDVGDAAPGVGADGMIEESIAALLEAVTSDAGVAMIPANARLASSACSWLGGLARWLGARLQGSNLRCAVESLPRSPGSPPVEASFRLFPVSHAARQAIRYVLAVLSHARDAAHGDAEEPVDTLDSVAVYVGARQGNDSGTGDDDSDTSDSAEEDGDGSTLARRASASLESLCRACSSHVVDVGADEMLAVLCALLYGGGASPTLSVVQRCSVLDACLSVCVALPESIRADALRFVLQPLLRDLATTVGAARAVQAGGQPIDRHGLPVAVSCALAITALGTASLRGSGALNYVADAALPLLEQAVIAFVDKQLVAGCALVALQLVVRAFPALVSDASRLSALLQLAVVVFQRHLSADALVLASRVIEALAMSVSDAAQQTASVATASAALVALSETARRAATMDPSGAAVERPGRSVLSRSPDAVLEFLRLCRGLVMLCPAMFVQVPVAEAAVLLVALSLESAQSHVARCGAFVLRSLTTQSDLRAQPTFAGAADAAVAAHGWFWVC